MLTLQVRHRLGSFLLEASLDVPAGGVTVLVGESGSGKSTLLRLVAGILEPQAGRIVLGDEVLSDRAAGRFVRAEARPVGYVAQDYALFPHLTAAENVAFGLTAMRLPRGEVRDRTARALERFGLTGLAGRRPHGLSGGQQQRVALARALVLDPEVLLLDEPLSALDLATRRVVRAELRRTLAQLSCATLFVTHHPTEALAFGDQIAVLENGQVSQCGSREDFVRHPRSPYVAEFLGVNWFEGEITSRPGDGEAIVQVLGGTLAVPDPGHGGAVRLVVHPHDIIVSIDPPGGSARNIVRGPIEEMIPELPAGERVRVLVGSHPPLTAQITRRSAESLGLRPGVEVFAAFKATGVLVLPA